MFLICNRTRNRSGFITIWLREYRNGLKIESNKSLKRELSHKGELYKKKEFENVNMT